MGDLKKQGPSHHSCLTFNLFAVIGLVPMLAGLLLLARFSEGLDLADSMSDESFERLGWCNDPPETNFAVSPEEHVLR
jgi:hypothetical protein